MKSIILSIVLFSSLNAGFFNEPQSTEADQKKVEFERLCKIFTDKVEIYKDGMRSDALAVHTLQSYEKRAKNYCDKARAS